MLAVLVWFIEARFDDEWRSAINLAYSVPVAAFALALAVLAPVEGVTPRPYQSTLYVASVAILLQALANLADGLGTDGLDGAGTVMWVFAVLAAVAAWFAAARNSAVCTLLAAAAAGVSVLAFVQWVFAPERFGPQRWVLLALIAAYALGTVAQRDRRPRHAVALADAGGLAALALGLSFAFEAFFGLRLEGFPLAEGAAWGWELVLVAVGFGLVAYASVDREPGPAYLGVANLAAFLVVAADGDSLLGWPLVLALGAGFLLVVGLRPTTPAPPPPDAGTPPAPTVDLPR
ncbi:MAG: hypothetical protein HZB46_06845 [Solirubrobacterales bacterium]|nr:hypothetical protein [Solirubrobacterales bacterium]